MNATHLGILAEAHGNALPPEVATTMVSRGLTVREAEILHYLVTGESNKRIGYALGISEKTVKNHITSLMRKLGSANRTQAALCAVKRGWISLETI